MLRKLAALAVVVWLIGVPVEAEATTLPDGFSEVNVASGLDGLPTAIDWAPDGRAFVAHKNGIVRVISPGDPDNASTLIDLRSRVNDAVDRGLLGIAVDKNFAANGYLYLLYVRELNPLAPDSAEPMTSRLTRVTVTPANTVHNPDSPETVILGRDGDRPCPAPDNTIDCIPADAPVHAIGTVRSDPVDGTLWIGSGDANGNRGSNANSYRPYNDRSFAGKIIHVDRRGRGLPDHPRCAANTNLRHVCTKVYAVGFRNPFRFTLRPGEGPVVGDVGRSTEDELDLLRPGGNYGWPCWEGAVRTPAYQDEPRCQMVYANGGTLPPAWRYPRDRGASIVAGPTYTGTTYPSRFRGDVFVADYVQGWIKRLTINSDDEVTGVHEFATDLPAAVDLEQMPSGDLAYVDIGFDGGGAVRRFRYGSSNANPIANASADPSYGDPPLEVQFTGSESSDPDGNPLSYDWDFGDGSQHSAEANPRHTYDEPGLFEARLTVEDGVGGSSSEIVRISVGDAPPVASIAAPTDQSQFRAGEAVELRGSATDREDGSLPEPALAWQVLLHHGSHVHEVSKPGGSTASFVPFTDHDADSSYEITLTATDSTGQSDRETVEVVPETSELTLASNPSGVPLRYTNTASPAPFTAEAAVGYEATVAAPQTFVSGGRQYRFSSWSDGGDREHQVTVEPADQTLTADYDRVRRLSYTPEVDTFVDRSRPRTSRGNSRNLTVGRNPTTRTLLRFRVTGINGQQVESAHLRLFQKDGSRQGGNVFALSSNRWSERTTWSTQPSIDGPRLGVFGRVQGRQWHLLDIGSAAVDGNGRTSFAIRSRESDASVWSSRETRRPPRLIVRLAE